MTHKQPYYGYTANLYFPSELHPDIVAVGQKSLTQSTKYESHEEREYVFVRAGEGSLLVNGLSFSLKTGDAIVFQEYDFHKFSPESEMPLVMDYLRISTGTYMYALSNPYQPAMDPSVFQKPHPPVHLQYPALARVIDLFDYLHETKREAKEGNEQRVFSALEIVGRFEREIYGRAKKPNEQKE